MPLEDDVPRADPNPDLQSRGTRPVVPSDRLLDRHRRAHRIGRPDEGGHDPIAEVLDEMPPARLDGARDQCVVLAAQVLGNVLAHPRTKLSRSHQVREENDGG